MVLCSWIDFADLWPLHFLQKIMHTRKRHQDMFQDLNRKLQHAEKEKESPTTDSKVSHTPLEPSPPGDTLVPAGAWEHLGALAECLTLCFVYIATNTCTTLDMESHKGTTRLSTDHHPRWKKNIFSCLFIMYGVCSLVYVCFACLCQFFAARLCRDGVRKAKAQLELNLGRRSKKDKNGFCRYISWEWKVQENVSPPSDKCRQADNYRQGEG